MGCFGLFLVIVLVVDVGLFFSFSLTKFSFWKDLEVPDVCMWTKTHVGVAHRRPKQSANNSFRKDPQSALLDQLAVYFLVRPVSAGGRNY